MILRSERVATPKSEQPEQITQQIGRTLIAEIETYLAVGERIRAARTAMAEKFGVPEEDFCVVVSENETERQAVLVYAAPNGLRKGSWQDIFNPDTADNYMVTVNGAQHDTRAAMTWEVYQGMVLGINQGQYILMLSANHQKLIPG